MRVSTLGSGASSSSLGRWLGAILLALMLAACGGSDNNSGLGGSSGGGSSGGHQHRNGSALGGQQYQRRVPISVNSSAAGFVNIPNVLVKVCAPGSTTICQTIDNIQLDTAPFGLRILSSSASAVLGNLGVTRAANGEATR